MPLVIDLRYTMHRHREPEVVSIIVPLIRADYLANAKIKVCIPVRSFPPYAAEATAEQKLSKGAVGFVFPCLPTRTAIPLSASTPCLCTLRPSSLRPGALGRPYGS